MTCDVPLVLPDMITSLLSKCVFLFVNDIYVSLVVNDAITCSSLLTKKKKVF